MRLEIGVYSVLLCNAILGLDCLGLALSRPQVLNHADFNIETHGVPPDELCKICPFALTKAEALDAHGPGPPGAVKRPQRFPTEIHFVWGFCMGAQGASQSKMAISGAGS